MTKIFASEGFIPVVGFEGLYIINEGGDVRAIDRMVNHSTKGIMAFKAANIRKHVLNYQGYWIVQLHKEGRKRTCLIHRLIAEAFIPNPLRKRIVNHINGTKQDNRIENLEWMTDSENLSHAYSLGLKKPTNQYTCAKARSKRMAEAEAAVAAAL
jgi:hypothetical protein